MEYRHILFDVSDEIATITLNRPEARNALSMPMREDLDHALAHVKENAGGVVKAMIVTGAGGAFCAGGDVKAMNNRTARAPEGHKDMQKSHDRVYNLLNMPLPVISLIDGPAAGAGANLALAADFVLMTPKSFIMQAFARIGLVPDWGGFYILPRLVGLQKAKELVYTGRRVYAEEAKEIGLAYSVVEKETAMDEARSFARKLCQGPTAAIGVSKNILNQSYNQDYRTMLELEAMAQTICRDTDFHKEAVRRFAAKETPLYDWESMKD